MKLFTVRLTADERAALEAHRVRLGLRSHAETVRALISGQKPIAVHGKTHLQVLGPAKAFTAINAGELHPPVPEGGFRGDELMPLMDEEQFRQVKPKPGSRLKKR